VCGDGPQGGVFRRPAEAFAEWECECADRAKSPASLRIPRRPRPLNTASSKGYETLMTVGAGASDIRKLGAWPLGCSGVARSKMSSGAPSVLFKERGPGRESASSSCPCLD